MVDPNSIVVEFLAAHGLGDSRADRDIGRRGYIPREEDVEGGKYIYTRIHAGVSLHAPVGDIIPWKASVCYTGCVHVCERGHACESYTVGFRHEWGINVLSILQQTRH